MLSSKCICSGEVIRFDGLIRNEVSWQSYYIIHQNKIKSWSVTWSSIYVSSILYSQNLQFQWIIRKKSCFSQLPQLPTVDSRLFFAGTIQVKLGMIYIYIMPSFTCLWCILMRMIHWYEWTHHEMPIDSYALVQLLAININSTTVKYIILFLQTLVYQNHEKSYKNIIIQFQHEQCLTNH